MSHVLLEFDIQNNHGKQTVQNSETPLSQKREGRWKKYKVSSVHHWPQNVFLKLFPVYTYPNPLSIVAYISLLQVGTKVDLQL